MIHGFYALGSHFSSVIEETASALRHRGAANILSRFGRNAEGIEKVSNFTIWFFSCIPANQVLQFLPAQKLAREAKDLLYSISFIRSFSQISCSNITSSVLMGLGALSEAVYMATRYGFIEKDYYSNLSKNIGSGRPSNFFLFFANLTKSIENVVGHYRKGNSWRDSLRAKDVLLHLNNVGSLILIYNNSMLNAVGRLRVVEGITHISELILFSIK